MAADLKTMFDSLNAKASKKKPVLNEPSQMDIPDIDEVLSKPAKVGTKKLSVERIYQKKSQLEHILLRPDTYIGSIEKTTQPMWVYDDDKEMMVQRDLTYVPGLYKIFDEILVNAADNKVRDPNMTCVKIDIDAENNKIKIWNNGKGIPVVHHKTENMYVPTMIFGHLLTSSNYDDSERKVTGGRNGYGAKLCNIFSTKFVVETQCGEYGKAFRQQWENNMGKTTEPKIVPAKGQDYTSITFYPDLEKFQMETLDKDIVDLFSRRAFDIAASTRGVHVFLNGKKLKIHNFKDYVDLYIKDKTDDTGSPLKCVFESVNPRWEVALTLSDKGFQQVSFVNSIATTKGGKHSDYVADQVISKLIEVIKKKDKKGAVQIKPFQVKNHLWVFVNCLIENPTFDSQTKENMTLQAKRFGSKCQLSEKFFVQANKCGIVESVQSWMKFKAQEKMNKKCSNTKQNKLKGIPKLDDANDAGTKNSAQCTLILTEGDSAKTLAVAGLSVVGRDKYGVFPLKGKLLNVREASAKQIMENAEINNIIKILGLRYKEKYDNPDQLKTLRYGKLMIMTDQDQDGSHIKGLLINFIHHNWPNLLRYQFVEEFITPLVKVTKGKEEKAFYSMPEFEEWKTETNNWHTYRVKYYKGLGTSTSKEAKEYFTDMLRHRIFFKYTGAEDDASIELAFSKKKVEERKTWLTNWMEERKRRTQLGLPEMYLYGESMTKISYNEFVNRELILFSNMDNERSIPSLVDGLKPGQRKVLYTCFKRNLNKEIKVAQLAGSVAEHSAYHHGENSLMGTIINLAQNFVGSNNINLLQPIGQFGTRLHGGKDAASPRYIFTALSPLARVLFNPHDDSLYKYCYDDNQKIEPEYYVPLLPMVLVNGAEGIGTGWSTKIPNHDPRLLVKNLHRLLDGLDPLPMSPYYKSFTGTVEQIDDQRFAISGEISVVDDQTVEITELPVKVWTQAYKESVLEPMLLGTDKTPQAITDYKEYHTDITVRYVIKMTPENLQRAEMTGLHKVFKIQNTISTSSMVLFDHNGVIRKFNNVDEILKEFFDLRVDFYRRRKEYLEGLLASESLKLDNQARFIMEKIEGKIVIENKAKADIIKLLLQRGYDSDPIKTWKEAQSKLASMEDGDVSDNEEDESQSTASGAGGGPDFNYLLNMALWCLTKEKKDELLRNQQQKADQLYELRKKSPNQLYKEDLDHFLAQLNEVEQKEKDEANADVVQSVKTAKGRKSKKKIQLEETLPSPAGRRVEPRIDPSLRAKVEAIAAKKKKAELKKEASAKEIIDLDDDASMESSEMKPLAERLKLELSPTVEAMKKTKGTAPAKKEKAKNTKKVKQEKITDFLNHDEDSDGDNDNFHIPARDVASRKTALKVKYTFSDDEEDGNSRFSGQVDFQDFGSESDSDEFVPKKKSPKKSPKKAKPKTEKKQKSPFDDIPKKTSAPIFPEDSDDDESQETVKSNLIENVISSLSDKEDDVGLLETKPKKSSKTKEPKGIKRPRPKKAVKSIFDSDDDDDILSVPSKKSKKKADDDDDFDPGKKKRVIKKKRKISSSEEEVDPFEMNQNQPAARERRGRNAAPTKYKFSDDSDDSDY